MEPELNMSLMNWLRWQNIVDFVVLTTAFYVVLLWARQTRALRFAVMIVCFHAAALCARHFDLTISSWVFDGASLAVIGVLVLLFQAQLQHSLLRWESIVHLRFRPPAASNQTYVAIAAALFAMAQAKIGALIVLTRKDPLGALISDGIAIDAGVSKGLLEAIFHKGSPLHDGAVVVEGDRIERACAILPMTQRDDVSVGLGTRLRAARGLAESSDALVLSASEEQGQVVLIDGLEVRPMADEAALRQALYSLGPNPTKPVRLIARVRDFFFANMRYRVSALGLASLIWGITFFGGGTTIRIVTAPVAFSNVPSGLYISSRTLRSVSVELRGNSWLMNPIVSGLTANVDISGFVEGSHTIRLTSGDFHLSPGVTVDRMTPESISVRLARRASP